eukprot:106908-Pelagomonas_calceolata.AAC.1
MPWSNKVASQGKRSAFIVARQWEVTATARPNRISKLYIASRAWDGCLFTPPSTLWSHKLLRRTLDQDLRLSTMLPTKFSDKNGLPLQVEASSVTTGGSVPNALSKNAHVPCGSAPDALSYCGNMHSVSRAPYKAMTVCIYGMLARTHVNVMLKMPGLRQQRSHSKQRPVAVRPQASTEVAPWRNTARTGGH